MEALFKSLSELVWTGWYRGSKRVSVTSKRIAQDGTMKFTLTNDDRISVSLLNGYYQVSLNGKIIYKNTNLDAEWLHSIYEWHLVKKGWKIH